MLKNVKRGMFFLVILSAISVSYMPKAIAGNYLGEFCWSINFTEGQEEGPYNLKVGITHMGDSYFTIQGIIDTPPGYAPVILNGSLIIIGQEIFMTINSSHDPHPSPKPDALTIQMRLDSSLNGTLWGIGLTFNKSIREFQQSYAAGTATFTSCP